MTIGILADASPENRVALTPENIAALAAVSKEPVMLEKGAGLRAFFSDADYQTAGAVVALREEVLGRADVLVSVNRPLDVPSGKVLVGGFNPLGDPDGARQLASCGLAAFSLDIIPRTTRAQAMDILSSMATVSGYRAVLLAATHLARFFPMFMTAAGSIKPAKVLVIGAGVAGLQAIATARRLGAVVEASDVRAAAKEEVLSLGAKFVEVEGAREDAGAGGYAVEQTDDFKKRQQAEVEKRAAQADVILCTAQIPGRKAPLIIPAGAVANMKPGSVIIDLAASSGGNCELTKNGETILAGGVTIIGDSNLAAGMPADASRMFGKNMVNFLKILYKDGQLNLDDELVAGTCVCRNGELVHERVRALAGTAAG
ncbi:MAG: NAD(P)(+) transhydrogenase (Re/Si-specific) subunit alpha [Bacteroidetes bacterium]|nr:NAD(P)(+) transhydrogenase (Re/Si-specific) subunit alpha [Bacteroidota bacterium]